MPLRRSPEPKTFQGHGLHWLVCLFLFCVAATPAFAQNTTPPEKPEQQLPLTIDRDPVAAPPDDATAPPPRAPAEQVQRDKSGFILKQNAYEVVLNATVLDAEGRLVENLDKSAFQVFEDNVPQTIAAFRHEDIPVSIGIMIDSSGSMYNKVQSVRKAAIDLIKASNRDDETFIVNFSDEAYIDQDLTGDLEKLQEALNLFKVQGGTAIYDTVIASADYLSKNAAKPKQVLVLITDGDDRDSSSTLETAIRRVQDLNGPVVYCIGLLFGDDEDHSAKRHSARVLQNLADQTGGLAFFPRSINEVDAIAAEVAKDIRSQYTIGYHSTKPYSIGGYRYVRVDAKAKGAGRLTVRTRTGYFPKTETSDSGTGATTSR